MTRKQTTNYCWRVCIAMAVGVGLGSAEETAEKKIRILGLLGRGIESREFTSLKTDLDLRISEKGTTENYVRARKDGKIKVKTIVNHQVFSSPGDELRIRFRSAKTEALGRSVHPTAPICSAIEISSFPNQKKIELPYGLIFGADTQEQVVRKVGERVMEDRVDKNGNGYLSFVEPFGPAPLIAHFRQGQLVRIVLRH